MFRVRDRVSDERIIEYIRTTSKHKTVTSTMVRQKFDMSAPTFYGRIKRISCIKIIESSGGSTPMTLEIDNETPVQAE